MATAKLASDLSSGSKKREPDNCGPTSEIYYWASQLASETRGPEWIKYWYIWPKKVQQALRQLDTMRGVIALVGRQGVGKSAALQAIYVSLVMQQEENRRRILESKTKIQDNFLWDHVVLFKWRRDRELFKSLFDETHELSRIFNLEYRGIVWQRIHDDERITDSEKYEQHGPGTLDLKWAQAKFGSFVIDTLRREAWLRALVHGKVVLIDMPDYSKTDRRLLARDLEGIYWLWNMVTHYNIEVNMVIAIQKEMFRDHFFFDKMEKVELEALKPEQMVEAYRKRFKAIEPFTEDALLALARMSRGIFRRFLRYITLTLQSSTRGNRQSRQPAENLAVTIREFYWISF